MPDARHAAEVLAAHAGLTLSRERLEVIAPILAAWRDGCLALNALMSAPANDGVVPVTVMQHRVEAAGG